MKKGLKTFLMLGGTALAGYMGYKAFRVVKDLNKLEKNLPDYLEGVCGEAPSVSCMLQVTTGMLITVKVTLSPETLVQHPELQELALDYIRENHSRLMKHKINVKLVERAEDKEGEECYSEPFEG